MPITLDGSNGITTPMYNGAITANAVTPSVNMKSRIINGAMVVDQRNAGASVTPANAAVTYTLDRWAFYVNQASKLTVQQSTTVPAGFKNSMIITSSSAYSSGASDIFVAFQSIEGLNVSDLDWGTANAKTVTLSFWARSSLTGTHSGALSNAGNARSYPFTFTISSANTYEYKTVTIAGDTSGTWLTTNSAGITLKFNCGSGSSALGTAGAWASADYTGATGSVSVVGTNGATFYITGVQLEVGSTATSFDYRPYGTELALCQRYFYAVANRAMGYTINNANSYYNSVVFPVTMRATPTLSSVPTAAFAVGAGSAGTVALNPNATAGTSSADQACFYNSANTWNTNTYVQITAGFSAEL